MLSRAAESLYWMARYLERAENTARLINATQQVLLDLPRGASFGWKTLTQHRRSRQAVPAELLRAGRKQRRGFPDGLAAQPGFHPVLHPLRARELPHHARRAAAGSVGAHELHVPGVAPLLAAGIGRKDRRQMLEDLIYDRQSVSGVLADCMSHDVAYQFIGAGRAHRARRHDHAHPRHPRPPSCCRRAAGDAADAVPGLLWVGVLNSLSGLQMYRRHAASAGSGDGGITGERVLQYLICDSAFPARRSCIVWMPSKPIWPSCRIIWIRCAHCARRGAVRPLLTEDLSLAKQHEFLDAVQSDLAQIHDAIAREYFHLHQRDARGRA